MNKNVDCGPQGCAGNPCCTATCQYTTGVRNRKKERKKETEMNA